MCDIFLCCGSRSAQTAKLFKRYMAVQGGGDVFYAADREEAAAEQIAGAKCAVVFLTEDFFRGLDTQPVPETGLELTAIERRLQMQDGFRMLTVYVDRGPLEPWEEKILEGLFIRAGIRKPESLEHFTQSSRIPFHTAVDYENELFRLLRTAVFPVVYHRDSALGSFRFCGESTNVDIIRKAVGTPLQISFSEYSGTLPFHSEIEEAPSTGYEEAPTDDMISVVGWECGRESDGEEQQILLTYKPIAYKLFHKCIQLWDNPSLKIREKMQEYDGSSPGGLFEIPNAMGLAMMVVTADNCLVFSRRSRSRRIRSGEYDCSIVEGLSIEVEDEKTGGYDVFDREYVENECLRVYQQEISSDLTGVSPRVNGILLDRGYGQWNITGTIFTPKTSRQLQAEHSGEQDAYDCNELIFVPLDKLRTSLSEMRHVGMWDTALAALQLTLERLGKQNLL